MSQIVLHQEVINKQDYQIISIDVLNKRRIVSRKRMARRLFKRYPMFAFQITKERYPEYNIEMFHEDIRKMKFKKPKKGKSVLARQGRYNEMKRCLSIYRNTGDINFLYKAQSLRNRMYLDYELIWNIKGEKRSYRFPSMMPYKLVIELSQLKPINYEQLDKLIRAKLKYTGFFI